MKGAAGDRFDVLIAHAVVKRIGPYVYVEGQFLPSKFPIPAATAQNS
jgi:hypothetical protein